MPSSCPPALTLRPPRHLLRAPAPQRGPHWRNGPGPRHLFDKCSFNYYISKKTPINTGFKAKRIIIHGKLPLILYNSLGEGLPGSISEAPQAFIRELKSGPGPRHNGSGPRHLFSKLKSGGPSPAARPPTDVIAQAPSIYSAIAIRPMPPERAPHRHNGPGPRHLFGS